MKFLLDTDHLSFLQQEAGAEYIALRQRIDLQSPKDLSASIVSFHEQTLGAHNYVNQVRTPERMVDGYRIMLRVFRVFQSTDVLPFNDDAMQIYKHLMNLRLRVNRMDLRIAATALSRDLTLLTRNVRDFGKIPNLRTEDWT